MRELAFTCVNVLYSEKPNGREGDVWAHHVMYTNEGLPQRCSKRLCSVRAHAQAARHTRASRVRDTVNSRHVETGIVERPSDCYRL